MMPGDFVKDGTAINETQRRPLLPGDQGLLSVISSTVKADPQKKSVNSRDGSPDGGFRFGHLQGIRPRFRKSELFLEGRIEFENLR